MNMKHSFLFGAYIWVLFFLSGAFILGYTQKTGVGVGWVGVEGAFLTFIAVVTGIAFGRKTDALNWVLQIPYAGCWVVVCVVLDYATNARFMSAVAMKTLSYWIPYAILIGASSITVALKRGQRFLG